MLHHPTVDQLHQLRLTGMAKALASQSQQADISQLSFEERLGLLIDSELAERESRQNTARLKRARLKQAATPEDVNFRHPRGLDRALFARLMTGRCCRRRKSVEIWRHKTAAEFGVDRLTHKGPGGPLVIYGRWGQKGGSFSGGSLRVMRSSRYRSSKAIS